jgi:hypothetical protein
VEFLPARLYLHLLSRIIDVFLYLFPQQLFNLLDKLKADMSLNVKLIEEEEKDKNILFLRS